MEEISVLGWVAIVATVMLELATTMVFLYQRTLRKLSLKLGVDQRLLVFLYPGYMLRMYQLSFLKWPLYIYLLFVNWIIAISIFVATFALSMIMPVVDWLHLLTMRRILKQKFYDIPNEIYASILSNIDSGLLQTGHDFSTIEEYKTVAKYMGKDDPDSVLIKICNRIMEKESSLFVDISQALIHIPIIRAIMRQQQ